MTDNISLKNVPIDPDKPNYYVGIDEGVVFDLCKLRREQKTLHSVHTAGLCGCIAIAIYIKGFNNDSYIFLNHISADYAVDAVESLIEDIEKAIAEEIGEFKLDDNFYEIIKIFVVGNQFPNPDDLTQRRRMSVDERMLLGDQIVSSISTRIEGDNNSTLHTAFGRSVGFVITDNTVTLGVPVYSGKLTYFGERHGGYGPVSSPNIEPYKDICTNTAFIW